MFFFWQVHNIDIGIYTPKPMFKVNFLLCRRCFIEGWREIVSHHIMSTSNYMPVVSMRMTNFFCFLLILLIFVVSRICGEKNEKGTSNHWVEHWVEYNRRKKYLILKMSKFWHQGKWIFDIVSKIVQNNKYEPLEIAFLSVHSVFSFPSFFSRARVWPALVH